MATIDINNVHKNVGLTLNLSEVEEINEYLGKDTTKSFKTVVKDALLAYVRVYKEANDAK